MSSDPKEPTPLSVDALAELRSRVWPRNEEGESASWCNLCGFGWPCGCTKMLATIDAQDATIAELQREIEGYRQTLERTVEALNAENARERRQHPDPQFASMVRDLGKRIGYGVLMTEASRLWAEEVGGGAFAVGHCISIVEAADREARRVLAGKEVQCPKCEGRGFIRTMVDGERDSEPCSFCRMSGLAGKEAQGD